MEATEQMRELTVALPAEQRNSRMTHSVGLGCVSNCEAPNGQRVTDMPLSAGYGGAADSGNQNPKENPAESSSQVPKRRKATRREPAETKEYEPFQEAATGMEVDANELVTRAASNTGKIGNLGSLLVRWSVREKTGLQIYDLSSRVVEYQDEVRTLNLCFECCNLRRPQRGERGLSGTQWGESVANKAGRGGLRARQQQRSWESKVVELFAGKRMQAYSSPKRPKEKFEMIKEGGTQSMWRQYKEITEAVQGRDETNAEHEGRLKCLGQGR